MNPGLSGLQASFNSRDGLMPAHSPAKARVESRVMSPPKSLEKAGAKAPLRGLAGAKSPAKSAAAVMLLGWMPIRGGTDNARTPPVDPRP